MDVKKAFGDIEKFQDKFPGYQIAYQAFVIS